MIRISAWVVALGFWLQSAVPGKLPDFPLGTVLVWKSENRGYTSEFVIRIARFKPDRYFEWESGNTQGTVLLKQGAVEGARKFTGSRLMQAGADIETNNEITYWLSRALFLELRDKGKTTFMLESIKAELVLTGKSNHTLQVNQQPHTVELLEARDSRGGIWGFLDDEANPILIKRRVNTYQEELASVSTNRPGSLRWIKGKRLKSGLP